MTYTVTVTFTVHPHSDPHLQGAQAVEEEFESWLESLKVMVQTVAVRTADERSERPQPAGERKVGRDGRNSKGRV